MICIITERDLAGQLILNFINTLRQIENCYIIVIHFSRKFHLLPPIQPPQDAGKSYRSRSSSATTIARPLSDQKHTYALTKHESKVADDVQAGSMYFTLSHMSLDDIKPCRVLFVKCRNTDNSPNPLELPLAPQSQPPSSRACNVATPPPKKPTISPTTPLLTLLIRSERKAFTLLTPSLPDAK